MPITDSVFYDGDCPQAAEPESDLDGELHLYGAGLCQEYMFYDKSLFPKWPEGDDLPMQFPLLEPKRMCFLS
jgi:hypothetical protein